MSKTQKKILVGFTIMCALVCFVFVVQLVALNRKGDDLTDTSLSASEDHSRNTDEPADNNDGNIAGSGDQPIQTAFMPTGKRYELPYTVAQNLVLYADDELFAHDSQLEMAEKFTYADGDEASLLIHFISFPLGVQSEAETFLDGYLEGNQSFVHGLVPIRWSSLTGVYVTGVKGNETFEVWLHSIPDGDADASNDIGMAFVIRYMSNEQKNALFTILDSIELETVQ